MYLYLSLFYTDLFLPVVQGPSVNSSHTIGVSRFSIQVNSLGFSGKEIQAQLKKIGRRQPKITWVTGAFLSPRTHRECSILVSVNTHVYVIVFVIRSSIEERWIIYESKERVSD